MRRRVSPYSFFASTPASESSLTAMLPPSRSSPSSRCPSSICPLPMRCASPTASSTALRAWGDSPCTGVSSVSPRPSACVMSAQSTSSLTPASCSARPAAPLSSRSIASSRCSQPTKPCPSSLALSWACRSTRSAPRLNLLSFTHVSPLRIGSLSLIFSAPCTK